MKATDCILLVGMVLFAFWMDIAMGYALPAYAPLERDDNETAGQTGFFKDIASVEPSPYYLGAVEKRFPQPRGPLDDCKSYFECKSRFIKYLDGLARMGKMGR